MMIIGSPIVRRLARPSASTARAVVGAKSFSAALDRERSSASSRAFVIDDDPPSTRGRRRLRRGDWSSRVARTGTPRGRASSSSLGVGGKGTTDDTTILRGGDCEFESKLRRDDASGVEPRYSLASTLNVAHVPSKRDDERDYRRVEVIGHRGSPYAALENTSRSFVRAAQAGANGVELDAFLLRCGTLVVFHGTGGDENPGSLASYCGGIEGSILDYTYDEAVRLLTFDEGYDGFVCGPSEMTRPGDDPHLCRVHTLEEVLATLRDHPGVPPGFVVYVELKGPGTSIPAVELVGRMDVGRMRVRYSSFDHSRIVEVREADERAVTGALFSGRVPDGFVEAAIAAGADEVHLRYDTCTYDRVREAHRAGLNTMAWFRSPLGMREDSSTKYLDVGNEDESMYRTVLRSGVGSLCVNRPEVMVKVLEGMNRLK